MSSFNSPAWSNRRLSLRRSPKGKVKISCRKGNLDLGADVAAGLMDLSETGVRMLVKEALTPGQEVSVTLEGQNHMRPLKLHGRVVWMYPADEEGRYRIGIELGKRLAYADYLKLT